MLRVAIYLLVLLAACGTACAPGWNDPPPPLPGQVCSPLEKTCTATRFCCDQNDTCGGDVGAVGCDPGMCCDVVGGAMESRRAPRPQRKP